MNNQEEFIDFINDTSMTPPSQTNSILSNMVHQELKANPYLVFMKLITIQGFIGSLTLLFCPQFFLSLTNRYDVFHYFHYTFGSQICMMICGSIFIGSGSIFAAHLLKAGEINLIRSSKILFFTAISLMSIAVFAFVGAEIQLILTAYWLIGAVISGVFLFEVNYRIHFKLTLRSRY